MSLSYASQKQVSLWLQLTPHVAHIFLVVSMLILPSGLPSLKDPVSEKTSSAAVEAPVPDVKPFAPSIQPIAAAAKPIASAVKPQVITGAICTIYGAACAS